MDNLTGYSIHADDALYSTFSGLKMFHNHSEKVLEDARGLYIIRDVKMGSISYNTTMPKIYVIVDASLIGYEESHQTHMNYVKSQNEGYVYNDDERPTTTSFYYTLGSQELIHAIQSGLYDNPKGFEMDLREMLMSYQFVETVNLVEETYKRFAPNRNELGYTDGYDAQQVVFVREARGSHHLEYQPDASMEYQTLQSVLQSGLFTLVDMAQEREVQLAQAQVEAQMAKTSLLGFTVEERQAHVELVKRQENGGTSLGDERDTQRVERIINEHHDGYMDTSAVVDLTTYTLPTQEDTQPHVDVEDLKVIEGVDVVNHLNSQLFEDDTYIEPVYEDPTPTVKPILSKKSKDSGLEL